MLEFNIGVFQLFEAQPPPQKGKVSYETGTNEER